MKRLRRMYLPATDPANPGLKLGEVKFLTLHGIRESLSIKEFWERLNSGELLTSFNIVIDKNGIAYLFIREGFQSNDPDLSDQYCNEKFIKYRKAKGIINGFLNRHSIAIGIIPYQSRHVSNLSITYEALSTAKLLVKDLVLKYGLDPRKDVFTNYEIYKDKKDPEHFYYDPQEWNKFIGEVIN